jgi:hypothetical protein
MLTIELPVSGRRVDVREPSGAEDALLAEAYTFDALLALTLVDALVAPADGTVIDWRHLPLTDLDVLVLQIRRTVFGDWIRAAPACPECGERMDIDFAIPAYLDHHASVVPDEVRAGERDGWFELADVDLAFRAPTAGDLTEVAGAAELARRCLRPADPPPDARDRAERALASIAPDLADELDAVCPECDAQFTLPFDPLTFALHELGLQAGTVFGEVHLIAAAYHWHEPDILALPRRRRVLYADLIRDGSRTAA